MSEERKDVVDGLKYLTTREQRYMEKREGGRQTRSRESLRPSRNGSRIWFSSQRERGEKKRRVIGEKRGAEERHGRYEKNTGKKDQNRSTLYESP